MLSCLCSLDRAYFALWCRDDNKDTESNVNWVPELLYSFLLLKGNLLLFSDLSPVETDSTRTVNSLVTRLNCRPSQHMLVERVEQSVEEDFTTKKKKDGKGGGRFPDLPATCIPAFQSSLFRALYCRSVSSFSSEQQNTATADEEKSLSGPWVV